MPEPRPADRHALLALGLFLLLDAEVSLWSAIHVHGLVDLLKANVWTAVAAGAWKLVGSRLAPALHAVIMDVLSSSRSVLVLAGLLLLCTMASLFVSSTHVKVAEHGRNLTIALVHGAADGSRAQVADTRLVRAADQHLVFLVPTWLGGRRTWLQTSDLRRTAPFAVWPWLPDSLSYPGDFEALALVRLLPIDALFAGVAADHPLRLSVADSAGTSLGTVSLPGPRGVAISALQPPAPDSLARAGWRDRLRAMGVAVDDPAMKRDVEQMLADWSAMSWVSVPRPLREREPLHLVLRDAEGTVVADTTILVGGGVTDVILRGR